VNNAGIIAGDYADPATHSTGAFVRVDGTNYPFAPEGATTSHALSMTNRNELFGSYYTNDGSSPHFFLVDVTTVPEPGLSLLCLPVLIALFTVRDRAGATSVTRK
jgi:hypothetical protein